jgi:hypothetical protein
MLLPCECPAPARLHDADRGVRRRYDDWVDQRSPATRPNAMSIALKLFERVRLEIGALESRLHQALHRQTIWIIGAVGAVVGLILLLDYLLQ